MLAVAAVPIAAVAAVQPNPDAELIRVCGQHIVNLRTYNETESEVIGSEELKDPLWLAYSETRDVITASRPLTIAGVVAKARAAKAEGGPDGAGMDTVWSFNLVEDIIRIHGEDAL